MWPRNRLAFPITIIPRKAPILSPFAFRGAYPFSVRLIDGTMRLNQAGQMIGKWWGELERKFPVAEN